MNEIVSLNSYSSYKPVDLHWLDKIPAKWELKRVKDLAFYQSGEYINALDFEEEKIYPVYGGNGLRGYADRFNTNGNYVLIGRQGALCGNINYADGRFWATEHCVVVYHKKSINVKWLGSMLEVMNLNQYSQSTAQPGLSVDRIKRLEIPLPSHTEQIQIANYLDTKTQAIDKKIKLLTTKIEYYKELRKTIINNAIYQGVPNDKSKPLKQSGIHYIPDIKENWKIVRVKDLFNIGRGRVIGQDLLVDNGKYPVYSSQTENNGCLGYIETYDFNADMLTWTTDGANAGTVFRRSGKFNCTNVCGTLLPIRKNLDLNYMVYALQESAKHNKRIDTNGAKIMNNEMAIIQIPFPPKEEQTEIATYLDAKTSTIDKITTNIQTQIETLKELRKTLINDVVTGKVKVIE